ncbi:uncharacterized protein METZ01_LOCUS297788 [marine metagenome]|uniref:Uncharacterized protein n=1 Tax=marine metagenome TaxID=408172 RepID=A0A382M7D6_9ZZZZ
MLESIIVETNSLLAIIAVIMILNT